MAFYDDINPMSKWDTFMVAGLILSILAMFALIAYITIKVHKVGGEPVKVPPPP